MVVHSSPYSSVQVYPEKKLLIATWFDDSIELDEEGVKVEIGKVLESVRQYGIVNVVVDVRHYPYRDNFAIQNWINHTYIPQIIECDVKRYAFVVEKIITSSLEDIQKYYDFSHDDMIVKYFESHEEAVHWVEAKE